MRCDIRPKHTIAVIMIMEECVKLNGKTIVCMNWSPVTLLPHIVKALKQQHSGKNLSALAYVQLHWLSFQGPTDLGIVISQHAVKCQVD